MLKKELVRNALRRSRVTESTQVQAYRLSPVDRRKCAESARKTRGDGLGVWTVEKGIVVQTGARQPSTSRWIVNELSPEVYVMVGVCRDTDPDQTRFERRWSRIVEERTRSKRGKRSQPKLTEEAWSTDVVRVGTGYRVYQPSPGTRSFDVGYSESKVYQRPLGLTAERHKNSMGRTRSMKGPEARMKVMNEVRKLEKRRPVSDYTGCGILHKDKVGKLKLKPTKPLSK
jgi:hypothetical protein